MSKSDGYELSLEPTEEIRLLSLVQSNNDDKIQARLVQVTLESVEAFVVVETESSTESADKAIGVNGSDMLISKELNDALHSLRSDAKITLLWAREVCVDQTNPSEQWQCSQIEKSICERASKIIVWCGTGEESCFFDTYLGAIDPMERKDAVDYASRLAKADLADIAVLWKEKGEYGHPIMAYLYRFLFRNWFRGAPLLQRTYIDDMLEVELRWGNLKIDWTIIREAAERLLVFKPTPMYLVESNINSSTPSSMTMDTDNQWLHACIRFGYEPELCYAWIAWLCGRYNDGAWQQSRFYAHVGASADDVYKLCDFEKQKKYVLGMEEHDQIVVPDAASELKRRLSPVSMPLDEPVWPPPIPEYQMGLKRQMMPWSERLPMLTLLPHGSFPDSPVQLRFAWYPRNEMPPFFFLLNSTVLNSTQNVAVLVNGMRFDLARPIAELLKLLRDQESAAYFWLWALCMEKEKSEIDNRDELERFGKITDDVRNAAAGVIDLYQALEKLASEENSEVSQGVRNIDQWLMDVCA